MRQATRFLLGSENWWVFDCLIAFEQEVGITATYNFYADPRSNTLKRWLLDPSYSIKELAQSRLYRNLFNQVITLASIRALILGAILIKLVPRVLQLEQAAGITISQVRQHWLRFGWRETWVAQASSGLKKDTTLMFNDRPGYRTSSALAWKPWNPNSGDAHPLTALPTVLMDSHCYDYEPMTAAQRRRSILHWIGECQAVHSQVAILWHPQTLTQDYGWSQGFKETIATFAENRL